MSDYHKQKIKEQGKQIAMLEAELARVKGALQKAVDDWDSDVPPIGIIDDLEQVLGEGKG